MKVLRGVLRSTIHVLVGAFLTPHFASVEQCKCLKDVPTK